MQCVSHHMDWLTHRYRGQAPSHIFDRVSALGQWGFSVHHLADQHDAQFT